MSSSEVDETVTAVRSVLENFVVELDDALGGNAQHIERVLYGGETLSRSDLASEPEEWTEDVLIDELIDALGLNIQPGRPNPRYDTPDWVSVEIPDFELEEYDDRGDGADVWVIGENKSVNKFEEAEGDIQDYLGKLWWPDYGIATDGFQWGAYRIEASNPESGSNGDVAKHYRSFVEVVDLRGVIRAIAQEKGIVSQQQVTGIDVEVEIQSFIDVFSPDPLIELLRREAPKRLRDERKGDVDAFYQLYIELLFGESDEYENEYESTLRNDIIQPDGLPDKDADIFAVELVNRLLFIKFLERRNVLDEQFLMDRVNAYNEGLPNTLYKTVFHPLFYELLNTELDDRPGHQQRGWKGDVPYLNGGLFRKTVPQEHQYDVANNTLKTVITDLIEGTELDFDIDPAILGSVFEKTINHLSEEEDRQEDLGAFYTPDDVTSIISQQSIHEKVREKIIEAYADVVTQEQEFRDDISDMPLEEIQSKIEAGVGWFGRSDGVDDALEKVENISVLDPACGSGHFLTAALDALHNVQLSLLRGKYGSDISKQDRYDAKRRLVLESIYGVDVDPVAVQIARLRTWLTIVEDGWEDNFDELPNIELNIVSGNSLIGLPTKQKGQTRGDVWDDRLNTLIALRIAYKNGEPVPEEVVEEIDFIDIEEGDEITKSNIDELQNTLQPEFNKEYAKRLTHEFTDEIQSVDEFERVTAGISGDTLHPEITEVKIKRTDGAALTDDDKARLDSMGCRVHQKSARMYVEKTHNELYNRDTTHSTVRDEILDNLKSVLESHFTFTEVIRQAVQSDLDLVSGDVFHWVAEFPEVVDTDSRGVGYDLDFDIVLGNPPYGDVLSNTEKNLLGSLKTASVDDIAAQFTERQFELLADTGYYGNIITLRIAYEKDSKPVREILEAHLTDGKIACFTRRPQCVFPDLQVRVAIVTGQKNNEEETPTIRTSRFIRFDDDNRSDRLTDISYTPTTGLNLGETIGGGENYAMPKLGTETARGIIKQLRDGFDRTIGEMLNDEETDHLMWRRRGAGYWINPMLTNLYAEGETPTSMYEMYFDTDLQRRCAFLILQSSLYYHYWMVYKNSRNIDWWEIEPFPFPDEETLEANEDRINELSSEVWSEMDNRFVGGMRTVFENVAEIKPTVDKVDDLLGEMYGLSEDKVQYVKKYDTEYGRTP